MPIVIMFTESAQKLHFRSSKYEFKIAIMKIKIWVTETDFLNSIVTLPAPMFAISRREAPLWCRQCCFPTYLESKRTKSKM